MTSESHTPVNTQQGIANGQPDPKTMEVLYDFLKNAPERQIDNAASLDSKMMQIFSVASVVVGLAGFSSGGLAPENWSVTVLLFAALASYTATVYIAFTHLSPRRWRRSLFADFWWAKLWNRDADEARHSLLSDLAKSYAHNAPILTSKAQNIHLALATTVAEVVLIGLALIASRVG